MIQYLKINLNKFFKNNLAIPPYLQPSHLPGLDGLRGVAIIIVLLSHLFMGTPYASSFSGDMGVEIFFVISGFLITSLLLKERVINGSISLKNFYIRRFLRILPLVYLFLLVLFILKHFSVITLPVNSFFSASFFYQNIPRINGSSWYVKHFWSLSVEEQFYLTFPLLLLYDLNKYIKVAIFIVVFVPIVGLLGYNKVGVFYSDKLVHTIAFIIINLFSKTVCILIGSLLSIMMFKGFFQFRSTVASRLLSVLLFVIALLMHTETSILKVPNCGLFLFPLLIGVVIILNLNEESFFTRFLSNPLIVYVGLISYSLYIWQQLFTSNADRILKSLPVWQNMVVLFAVAMLSYHIYEKPFVKLKARFNSSDKK